MKNGSMVQLDRPEDEMTLFVNGDPVKVSKTKTKSKKDCPPEKRISVKGDMVCGMKGDEDLGQDIHHDGTPLHYNK